MLQVNSSRPINVLQARSEPEKARQVFSPDIGVVEHILQRVEDRNNNQLTLLDLEGVWRRMGKDKTGEIRFEDASKVSHLKMYREVVRVSHPDIFLNPAEHDLADRATKALNELKRTKIDTDPAVDSANAGSTPSNSKETIFKHLKDNKINAIVANLENATSIEFEKIKNVLSGYFLDARTNPRKGEQLVNLLILLPKDALPELWQLGGSCADEQIQRSFELGKYEKAAAIAKTFNVAWKDLLSANGSMVVQLAVVDLCQGGRPDPLILIATHADRENLSAVFGQALKNVAPEILRNEFLSRGSYRKRDRPRRFLSAMYEVCYLGKFNYKEFKNLVVTGWLNRMSYALWVERPRLRYYRMPEGTIEHAGRNR